MIEKLCIGSAQFGLNYGINNTSGMVSEIEIHKVLSLSLKYNINMIDTAHAYGQSEERIGKHDLSGWNIVTKIPSIDYGAYFSGVINKFVESSLARMKIDSLYGLLIHDTKNFLDHPNYSRILSDLIDLKNSKIVKKIGLSIYDVSILKRIDYSDLQHFDIIQCPFNLADQRLLESPEIIFLKSIGAEIHARSIFLQGLLLMNRESRPVQFLKFNQWFESYDAYITNTGYSRLEACLKFALHTSILDRVIVGIDSSDQLLEMLSLNLEEKFLKPDQISCNSMDLIDPTRWNSYD